MVGSRNKIILRTRKCARFGIHAENIHQIFFKAELKCNDYPLACLGEFSAQRQVCLNGLDFGMASQSDVP